MVISAGLLLLFAATDLGRLVEAALDATPTSRTAFWGIQIVELDTGKTLYELNPDRFFVPASNTKLFTTALALDRLGPEHRFPTVVLARGADLILAGSGHPIGLDAIELLADQVAAKGVRRLEGDIIGDDTAFPWAPYPDGWAAGDAIWDYGAPVSALTVNSNVFAVNLGPDGAIQTEPAIQPYALDNRASVGPGGALVVHRDPGSRQVRLRGRYEGQRRILLAVEDPAEWAAQLLLEALTRRGIAVAGRARARHAFPHDPLPEVSGVELARHTSPPLVEDLRRIDQVSQNLHAELALRAVAKARRGRGTREDGIDELKLFLDEAGITPAGYNFADGSGLSRLNLVTPRTVARLLLHMYASPARDAWISLLPVAGRDGTLRGRFLQTPAEGRLRAKTGTLSHVAALSGYAGGAAFAILVNNYHGPSAEIRRVVDTIGTLLVE